MRQGLPQRFELYASGWCADHKRSPFDRHNIDKQFFAGTVLLAHDRIDFFGPLTVKITKLDVFIDSPADIALCIPVTIASA